MRKVSIVIPVYNSELYVEQCILSAIHQTYSNLEILIIDDGSTDHSFEICQKFSSIDNRIQTLKQQNKGVSSARNRGINAATGEYIFFLDSDDAIHPLLIEEAIKQAERYHTELILCECLEQNNWQLERKLKDASLADKRPIWHIVEHKEIEEWFHIRKKRSLLRVGGMICRDCIKEQYFNEKLTYGEDALFMYYLISKPIRMSYTENGWYYYRINPKGLSHFGFIKNIENYLNYVVFIRDAEYQKGHIIFAQAWEGRLIYEMKKIYLIMRRKKRKEKYWELKKLAIAEIKNPLLKQIPLRRRILFICCIYFPQLYGFLEKFQPIYNKIVYKQ